MGSDTLGRWVIILDVTSGSVGNSIRSSCRPGPNGGMEYRGFDRVEIENGGGAITDRPDKGPRDIDAARKHEGSCVIPNGRNAIHRAAHLPTL